MKKNKEEQLQEAIEMLQDGKSIRYVERTLGISNLRDKISSDVLEQTMENGKDSDIQPKDVKLNPNRDNGVYRRCWEGTYICKKNSEESDEDFVKRKRKQYGKERVK